MSSEESKPVEKNELIIRRESGLVSDPNDRSPALTEIIGRSLVHLKTRDFQRTPQRQAGEEREFEIAPGAGIVMCWVPPGELLMGSPENEEGRYDDERQHRVRITKGFWLAKTQITEAQWTAVMGSNPLFSMDRNVPIEGKSWNDICGDEIIVSKSQLFETFGIKIDFDVNDCWSEFRTRGFLKRINKMATGGESFDLPTEAQWEYACRAGSEDPYYGNLDDIAWYEENSDNQSHPVGLKMPNKWGLHDMLGNVWEWCADRYSEYPVDAVTDPGGPADPPPPNGPFRNTDRVLRGGSWYNEATLCNAASRLTNYPGDEDYMGFGFRIARSSVS